MLQNQLHTSKQTDDLILSTIFKQAGRFLTFNYQFCIDSQVILQRKLMRKIDMCSHYSFQGTYSSNDCYTGEIPFENVVDELHKSQSLLCQFVKSLQANADSPISNIVYGYCQKYHKFHLTGSQVQNLVRKRIQRMTKNKRIKRNWNQDDEKIIVWVLSKYMQRHSINSIADLGDKQWEQISSLIPGSTPKTFKLAAKKWSHQEEIILSKLVQEELRQSTKKKWKLISERLFLENQEQGKIYRDPKQCKQHWNCHLNPELRKGPWTKEDDAHFLRYIRDHDGKKRWVEMVKVFPTRTENSLKNRYSLLMADLRKKYPKKTDEHQMISSFLKKFDSKHVNSRINGKLEAKQKNSHKATSSCQEEKKHDLVNQNKTLPLDFPQHQEYPSSLIHQEGSPIIFSPQQCQYYLYCFVPNLIYPFQ